MSGITYTSYSSFLCLSLQNGSRNTDCPKGSSGSPQGFTDISEDLKESSGLVCYTEACRGDAKLGRYFPSSHLRNVVVKHLTGIDPGTKPSTLQMLKLATNSEFKEASKNVFQEIQNAGVDLTSKVVWPLLCDHPRDLGVWPGCSERITVHCKGNGFNPKSLSAAN